MYLPLPSLSSMLSPKMSRYSMLPRRWAMPPCMNIEVSRVRYTERGVGPSPGRTACLPVEGSVTTLSGVTRSLPERISAGTADQEYVKRGLEPKPCNRTKTSTFTAMNAQVTKGFVVLSLLSSPMGIMRPL